MWYTCNMFFRNRRTGGAAPHRAGFTLIELLVVVAMLAVMVSAAAVNVISGTSSAKINAAVRGVVQMTRFARTMALLKQRPVRVTFHSTGKIDLQTESSNSIPGADSGDSGIGPLAAPVSGGANADGGEDGSFSRPAFTVDGKGADAGDGDGEEEDGATDGGEDKFASDAEKKEWDDVEFFVEILDETGNVLSDEEIAEKKIPGASIGETEPDANASADSDFSGGYAGPARTVSVVYETTGRCPSFRVGVRRKDTDSQFRYITVDRFGRTRVEDPEERR